MQLLDALNDKQRKAAEIIDGPVLILAGAGSGKTRTIMYRIAHILTTTNIPPYRILALTFTNKAAGEMKERIRRFGIADIEEMWIGTFHSIFARILRRSADEIGFSRSFTIYDESDSKNLITKCIQELSFNDRILTPSSVKEIISRAKNSAILPEEFDKHFSDSFKYEQISQVYSLYQQKLMENNAMDFDDLLLNTMKLFKANDDILSYYQDRFIHILVDEYQDTNALQYQIISMIAAKRQNICVCGDDDQSIYSFRGADIRNILEFENDFPNARVIRLEQNYRSTATILNAANHVIANNENRKGKNLWTDKGDGEKIRLLTSGRDIDEAERIAFEIERLTGNGMPFSDIAILYRVNSQSRILEEGLIRHSIPYQIVAGTRFYERLEIKDILAYLKVAVNPLDTLSFIRAISAPKRGIGAATIGKLFDYCSFKQTDLLAAMKNADNIPTITQKAKEKFKEYAALTQDIIDTAKTSLTKAVELTITQSGYLDALKNGTMENKDNRIENLYELINAAADFETSSEDKTLSAFLENAALVTSTDNMNEGAGQVLLMTIHNSKGLEFETVFIAGMEEGLFPLSKAMDDPMEMEEERRLCYVAMTRAKSRLFLSMAEYRKMYGFGEYHTISRFYDEIPKNLINADSAQHTYKPKASPSISAGANMHIKTEVRKTSPDSTQLKAGDTILHPTWGKGTVISAQPSGADTIITAAFAGIGIKRFITGFADIKKVN